MGNSVINNKLLLQYLSAAGADIASGNPIGQNINAVTQQQIGAQSKVDLMKKMLSGFLSSGGKMSVDGKGINLQIPHMQSSNQTQGVQNQVSQIAQSGVQGANVNNNETGAGQINSYFMNLLSSFLNPKQGQLENITPDDLAGLSSSDVSQALQGAIDIRNLSRERLNAVVNALYKNKLMNYYDTLIGKETPSVTIPGTDIKLTRNEFLEWYKNAQKDERTAAIKNFEYAKQNGFKGSFEDFLGRVKTTHQKDYEYYVEQEKKMGREPEPFNKWLLDVAKAGGISIGELIGRKKSMANIAGQLYFKDPKWVDDLDKYLNSESVQYDIAMSDDEELAKAREAVIYIENKIKAGGGRILKNELSKDGRTMTWVVKWPSGDKETIKHDIRP